MAYDDKVKLDKHLMVKYLSLLNDKLKKEDEQGEVLLFGGAAMCLLFGSRRYTRDIDAVFDPKGRINEYISEIAKEHGLDNDWLNDGVKGFLYSIPQKIEILSLSNLKVFSADPEYILAMKCYAARTGTDDLNDARQLMEHLGLRKKGEVLTILEKYIPVSKLTIKNDLFVEGLFEDEDDE